MASLLSTARPSMSFQCMKLIARTSPATFRRALSTLSNNSHIYVHPQSDKTSLLSFLSSTPPNPSLAIGTTTHLPPTPNSFRANEQFLGILHHVIRENAVDDPHVQGQAAMFASQAGSSLGSGGMLFPSQQKERRERKNKAKGDNRRIYGSDGAGGASAQGGMGGAGRGGYIHVADMRNPPDYGRVAWPEDIFGSLELDGEGQFVDGNGRYQEAGTYRIVTNEGILDLSPYLREKLVARLMELDQQARKNS
ncbi:Hypothetical protein R9X50_00380600 [Acrodontium crateriforme]|uniref:Uncharacterized protein n=1 Tax=Acrodontium crateriforme TaxID=150365 RepID=A0AAQ3M372_9PEZI|nr:Hypothetical protein R9X50_00380600 [Acrodontium crateriforme]